MVRCSAVHDVQLEKRTYDPVTGFMRAPAALARTGIQNYTAKELKLDEKLGLPPAQVIRMMRPAQEVFAADALASFEQAPVTINHPDDDVTAENWRDYAGGEAYGIAQAGDLMKGTLCVKDAGAVAAVKAGKAQISCGYDFDVDMTPGKTTDGLEYDAVMRNIRGNHVAIVDAARGGPRLRIADRKARDQMETTKVKIGKFSVRVVDAEAQTAQDAVDALVEESSATKTELAKAKDAITAESKKVADAATAATAKDAAHATALAAKDAEIAELKAKQPKPGDVEAAAEARTLVLAGAAKVTDSLDPKGKTTHQIRVIALDAVLKGEGALKTVASAVLGGELAKADEGTVTKAFDAVVAATAAATEGRDAAAAGATNDDLAAILAGVRGRGASAADSKPVGRDAMIATITANSRKPITKAA